MPESPFASQPTQKSQSSEVLLQVAITALRRWWLLAIPSGIVLAAVAMAVVFLTFVPSYRAAALVRIKSFQPRIVFDDAFFDNSGPFVSTQRELMRSPLVLGPVISRPEIASLPELRDRTDPRSYLAQKIEINPIENSELYEISFTGPDGNNGAKIINAILNEFFKFHDDVETQRADRVIELLQTEHDHHGQRVALLRNQVRELSTSLTGQDPSVLRPTVTVDVLAQSRLAFLETELARNAVDQAMHRSQLTAMKELANRIPVKVPEATVDAIVADDEEVQILVAAIAEKRKTQQSIRFNSALGEQDPVHQQISQEISQELETLKQTRESVAQKVRTSLTHQHELDLQQLEARLVTAEVMEEALTEQYNEELSQSRQVTGDTLELEFKRGELARVENVHAMILSRIVELQTERRAPARIELLADAEPPKAPVETLPFKQMFMAGGVGLCLPMLLAIGFEYRLRRVSDLDQWKTHSTLPVLAEIAKVPFHTAFRPQEALEQPPRQQEPHFFEEAIHGLRTRLMLSESLRNMKVLVVTSAVSGEGKSSVASQLAFSFARSTRKKVLLIDGDLRAPDLHKVFDVSRDPGLADILQDAEPPAAIRTVLGDQLHLLAAGRPATDTHALVGAPEMERLIDQARDMYDIIIIDTPPVLAAYETLVLSKAADAVVLCVMRDTSRFDQVATAHEKLLGAGISPIGVVISGVTRAKYAHSYGKYRYSDK